MPARQQRRVEPRSGRGGPPLLLAGFVEPGESAEQTLVREVEEEVGVHVTDLR